MGFKEEYPFIAESGSGVEKAPWDKRGSLETGLFDQFPVRGLLRLFSGIKRPCGSFKN